MAAAMRSQQRLLLALHKTATNLCYSSRCVKTVSVTKVPMQAALVTRIKPHHLERPALCEAFSALAVSPTSFCWLSQTRSFSAVTNLSQGAPCTYSTGILTRFCLSPETLNPWPRQPRRTIIRYSRNKGKKKTVKAVLKRFYRFSNGLWLRTIAGRNKHRWKKSTTRKRRNKWHVFCNKQQSKMLDRMVTTYWKRRRYIPDDPLEPFQDRHFKGLNFYPGPEILKQRCDPDS